MFPSDDDVDFRSQLKKAYEAPAPDKEFVAQLGERLNAELEQVSPPSHHSRPLLQMWTVISSRLTLAAAALLLAFGSSWLWWQNSQLQATRDQQASLRNEAETGLQHVLAAMDRYDRAVQDSQKPTTRDVRMKRQEWLQSVVHGYETLAKTEAMTISPQWQLGRAYLRLAEGTASTGARAQAIEQYQRGVAILEKLIEPPAEGASRDELANAYHNLGVLYRETGQSALADRAFEQALESYRQRQPPPDQKGEYALKLGDLYSDRAIALAAAGKLNEALDCYAQAIQTLEGIPHPQLQAQDGWRVFFLALAGRSRTLTALGRRTESLQDWDRALELANRYGRDSKRIIGPPGEPLVWGSDVEGGAPYVFEDPKDRKNLIGFEMDLAKALTRELGRPLQFKQYPWPKLFEGLDKGDFDFAMNGLEVLPHRLQQYRFSRPYFVYKLQLVVRTEDKRFGSLQDCRNHKDAVIGVLANTAAEWHLDRLGIKRKSYPAQLESYSDLLLGRIDGVLCDTPGAGYYVNRYPKLRCAGEPMAPGFYAIAVNPRNEALLSEMNVALERLLQTGELRRIYEKWGLWNADQEGLKNFRDLIDGAGQPNPATGQRPN